MSTFVVFFLGVGDELIPIVNLARSVQKRGHQVRVVTTSEHRHLLEKANVGFSLLSGSVAEIAAELDGSTVANSPARILERFYRSQSTAWLNESHAATQGAQYVLSHGPLINLAITIAEFRKIPFIELHTSPIVLRSSPESLMRLARDTWRVQEQCIGRIRERLDLQPFSELGAYGLLGSCRWNVLAGTDPSFLGRSYLVPKNVVVTGHWYAEQQNEFGCDPSVHAFVNADRRVLMVALNAVHVSTTKFVLETLIDVVRKRRERMLILTDDSWAIHLSRSEPDLLMATDSVDVSLLLPKVHGLVQSGSASLSAEALRAGIPSLVIPGFGDEFFWAHFLARLGNGIAFDPKLNLSERVLDDCVERVFGGAHDVAQLLKDSVNQDGTKNATGVLMKLAEQSEIRSHTERRADKNSLN